MALHLQKVIDRIKYFKQNWKLVIHLLFGTYRFGVDNSKWSSFDSMFGVPLRERFIPSKILQRYRMMKVRASCGFIPKEDFKKMFGRKEK